MRNDHEMLRLRFSFAISRAVQVSEKILRSSLNCRRRPRFGALAARMVSIVIVFCMLSALGCGDDPPPEPRVDAALCTKVVTDACPVWFSCIEGTAITYWSDLAKCTGNAEGHCKISGYWRHRACSDVDDALLRTCQEKIVSPSCSELPPSCETIMRCYAHDFRPRYPGLFM